MPQRNLWVAIVLVFATPLLARAARFDLEFSRAMAAASSAVYTSPDAVTTSLASLGATTSTGFDGTALSRHDSERFAAEAAGTITQLTLHQKTVYVVAMRGTQITTVSSYATAGHVVQRSIDDGAEGSRVHAGFLKLANVGEEALTGVIGQLTDQHDTRVVLTGHSAGGAAVTLLAVRLCQRGVSPNRITVYTFGAPPLGNTTFHQTNHERFHLYRLRTEGDPIPTSRPLQVLGFNHVGAEGLLSRGQLTWDPPPPPPPPPPAPSENGGGRTSFSVTGLLTSAANQGAALRHHRMAAYISLLRGELRIEGGTTDIALGTAGTVGGSAVHLLGIDANTH